MQCKPKEAKNYKCCTEDKQCIGDECMAWRFVYAEIYPNSNFPRPPDTYRTEIGYCGLAYK